MAVEQELTRQVQQTSQLLELFLQHTLGPLTVLRRTCRRIAASGDAGRDAWMKQAPPLHETDVSELKENLVKVVNILRFAADVLEAREHHNPSVAEAGLAERIEESKEYATGWLKS